MPSKTLCIWISCFSWKILGHDLRGLWSIKEIVASVTVAAPSSGACAPPLSTHFCFHLMCFA